ncbi:MAG: type II toxin-antitoxin system PemK/MazF family toxin, partial [Pseudolysinimonas sp.]
IGGIYFVADSEITLPPEKGREVHDAGRRFLVLSGRETNNRQSWPLVIGCPISGSTSFRTEFDVLLGAGEFGTIKKCWVRVPALQPILKTDLGALSGTLDTERLNLVQARVFEYLGLAGA